MTTRTLPDRAAQSISGAVLKKELTVMTDERMVETCERLGLFHRGHRRAGTPTMSQWIYNMMVEALKAKNQQ